MHSPTLQDDGATVVLDLHGLNVDEALRLARAVVSEAARRGRQTVRLIHGTSTSSTLYRNRTIKHEITKLAESGGFGPAVQSQWSADGYVLLALSVAGKRKPELIRLSELLRY